jgi:hypothetical protein
LFVGGGSVPMSVMVTALPAISLLTETGRAVERLEALCSR